MQLLPMTDAHYAWLAGTGSAPADAPRVAEGGIAPPDILELMRGIAMVVGGEASWLMAADGEGVGLISIKLRDAAGRWDIGYGVAPTREGRGHATAAVAALQVRARTLGATGLTAETLSGPGASAQVLRRNGFTCTGQFDHPEDGRVDQWKVEW